MSSLVHLPPWHSGYEWDEADETEMLGCKSIMAAANSDELLVAVILADRGQQNPSHSKPVDQG